MTSEGSSHPESLSQAHHAQKSFPGVQQTGNVTQTSCLCGWDSHPNTFYHQSFSSQISGFMKGLLKIVFVKYKIICSYFSQQFLYQTFIALIQCTITNKSFSILKTRQRRIKVYKLKNACISLCSWAIPASIYPTGSDSTRGRNMEADRDIEQKIGNLGLQL